MEIEAVAEELVKLAIARNASRIIEIDRMVDILKRLFPQHSEHTITEQLIHQVSLRDGAVAWTGVHLTRTSKSKTRRQAPIPPRYH